MVNRHVRTAIVSNPSGKTSSRGGSAPQATPALPPFKGRPKRMGQRKANAAVGLYFSLWLAAPLCSTINGAAALE
jgi:hypothetical protein